MSTITNDLDMKKTIKIAIASFALLIVGLFAFSINSSAQSNEYCVYLQEDDMELCDPAGNTCFVVEECREGIPPVT